MKLRSSNKQNVTQYLTSDGTRFVYSYAVCIGIIKSDGSALRTEQKYSVTTSKHCGKYLPGMATRVPQLEIDKIVHQYKEQSARDWGKYEL